MMEVLPLNYLERLMTMTHIWGPQAKCIFLHWRLWVCLATAFKSCYEKAYITTRNCFLKAIFWALKEVKNHSLNFFLGEPNLFS